MTSESHGWVKQFLVEPTIQHYYELLLCKIIDTKFVLGCGSNVVDQIHKVQAVPDVGTKGFFLRYNFQISYLNKSLF